MILNAAAPLLILALLPVQAMALQLQMPGNASLSREVVTPLGDYALPLGPVVEGYLPSETRQGEVTEQVWQVDAEALTTLQMLEPLRVQLVAEGFEILLDCETEVCGGFDFRLATRVLPPPEMHVDLGDFRFLSARRGDEAVSFLVSRTSLAGYVQIIRVGPPGEGGALTAPEAPSLSGTAPPRADDSAVQGELPSDFGVALEERGHVVLSDLAFQTGSAQLAEGAFASLDALAAYLLANPERRVALVGHTDSEGSLDANIALSKRRAGSVLERLVTAYDVSRQQLTAEGMGFLAPVQSNLTEAGRDANRRVEVILLSTE